MKAPIINYQPRHQILSLARFSLAILLFAWAVNRWGVSIVEMIADG